MLIWVGLMTLFEMRARVEVEMYMHLSLASVRVLHVAQDASFGSARLKDVAAHVEDRWHGGGAVAAAHSQDPHRPLLCLLLLLLPLLLRRRLRLQLVVGSLAWL
jgi:hypothetical protein